MDRSWLDDVDTRLRGLLLGSAGDFREGIASETAQQWLQQVRHSKRQRLGEASVRAFLTSAVARSLFQTIESIAPDPESRARWILILDRWLKQGTVSHELSGLLDPHSRTSLDVGRLERELESIASSADAPLPQHVPKPRAMDFVRQFQRCVAAERTLSKAIGKEMLDKMVHQSTPPTTQAFAVDLDLEGYQLEAAEAPDSPDSRVPGATEESPRETEGTVNRRGRTRAASRRPNRTSSHEAAGAGAGEETDDQSRPSSVPLFASHWVEDSQSRVRDMNAALTTGLDYWYGFRIAREVRAGASQAPFVEPAALKGQERTVVFLEVTSALLGPDNFERRRTVYIRGRGIADQYFRLRAEAAGSVPLRVQIVHDNVPVYSQSWTLQVAEGPVPVPAREGSTAIVAEPPTQGLGAVGDFGPRLGTAFRFKCDRERMEILSPFMQSWPGRVPRLMANPHDRVTKARGTLRQFSEEKGLEKAFTKDTVGGFLREMAIWGRECYDLIFDDSNETLRNRVVEKLPVGTLLTIDTDAPSFPWEWLFLGEVPRPDDDFLQGDSLSRFLDGFWGIRFGVSVLPTISGNRIGLLPVLSNSGRTRVLSSINPTAYPETAKANLEMIETLPVSFHGVETEIAQGREETIEMLRRSLASATSPHFVYFYCHHQAGERVNEFGYLEDKESVLFLRGEDEEPLSVSDLKHDVRLAPFLVPQTPLVFLNACGTSQGQDFHPSGFVPYFTRDLLAASVVGTLAEIPAGQGLNMASDFLRLWFRGMPAATALQFLRRQWLEEKLNPFAMYYSLNGIAHLSLARRLES